MEAALEKYREMKAAIKEEYYFDEASFNSLGYRFGDQILQEISGIESAE